MKITYGIVAAALISVSLTMPAAAESTKPKSVPSLSDIRPNIESPAGRSFFDEEMNGATRQDGFGTVLPSGVTAEDVVHLMLPEANASLATLVGMKRWPYRKDIYVAFVCIAPSQLIKDRVIKGNNGHPFCSPQETETVPDPDKPGRRKAKGDHLMAIGMLRFDAQEHLSLASTVISWSGINAGPLSASWEHSNLAGPPGDVPDSMEDEKNKGDERDYPGEFYRLDFANYAITNDNTAFGFRSGINIGYSGGGANYQILTLFAVIDGNLRVIFSEPIYYFQNIAGNWNEDGTRNHDIYEGENTVSVLKSATDGYFKLLVKSKKERYRKIFHWDPNTKKYVPSGKAG